MNTEKPLSHDESLQIIQSMIGMAKNKITEDGFHFVLWGVLCIVCSLVNYALLTMVHVKWAYLPWMLMPLAGAPAAIIYEARKKKKEQVKNYMDQYYGYIWSAFGITLFCIIYFSVKSGASPIPFILALAGMATFVSGRVFKFTALIAGAIVLWACSFIAVYTDPATQLLVNAGALLAGYIIPGVLLWKNYKSAQNV